VIHVGLSTDSREDAVLALAFLPMAAPPHRGNQDGSGPPFEAPLPRNDASSRATRGVEARCREPEGGRDGVMMMLNLMLAMLFRMKAAVDELWTYHVPTRTQSVVRTWARCTPEQSTPSSPGS